MKRVYFARSADGTGPIKIGCSAYIEDRLYQLGVDYRSKFQLLAAAPGDERTERNLHLKFEALRVEVESARDTPPPGATEWFAASPELIAFVAKVAATGKIILQLEEQRELVFARRYLNGETLQEIANDHGITRERVRQVLRKAGVPSLGLRPEHRQKQHELTANELAAASAYRRGELPKVICERFSLDRSQLHSACRRLNIEIRAPGAPFKSEPESTARTVASLYKEGATLEEIRARFGWSHITYVYRWLKRAGVEPNRRAVINRVHSLPAGRELVAGTHIAPRSSHAPLLRAEN